MKEERFSIVELTDKITVEGVVEGHKRGSAVISRWGTVQQGGSDIFIPSNGAHLWGLSGVSLFFS